MRYVAEQFVFQRVLGSSLAANDACLEIVVAGNCAGTSTGLLRPGHIVALEPLHDQHERGCVWVGPWTAINHKSNECRVCPCYQVLFRLNLLSRNLGNAVSQVTTSSIEARLVKADCTVFRGRAFCTTKSPTKKIQNTCCLGALPNRS